MMALVHKSDAELYQDALLLRSLSLHKLNQIDTAIKTLDTLQNFNPVIAKWYKGLIYLSNNQIEKAEKFIIIPNNTDDSIKLKEKKQ